MACSSSSICTTCATGYYLNVNICSLCTSTLTGCSACSSSSVCTTCSPGYALQTSNVCLVKVSSSLNNLSPCNSD
jgi:recombinational DNA repair protein (RecF pathway)